MRQTFKKRTQYKFDLYLPLSLLATAYFASSKFKRAAETLMEIFELLKETEVTLATVTALNAFNAYKNCEMSEQAQACLKKAVETNSLGNEEFFHVFFKRFIKPPPTSSQ